MHNQIIMLERGFEERKIMNVVDGNKEAFDINIPFVRDAILYYTIQQYFNNKDTFNKLGYKAKINTHTTSYIN